MFLVNPFIDLNQFFYSKDRNSLRTAFTLMMKEKYTDASPLQYFLKGKKRRSIHPETSDLLESWLTLLAEQGEEAAFTEVRKAVKAARYRK